MVIWISGSISSTNLVALVLKNSLDGHQLSGLHDFCLVHDSKGPVSNGFDRHVADVPGFPRLSIHCCHHAGLRGIW